MAVEAGDRSPSESEFLSRRRNYLGSIKKDLKDLQGARALMGELTQNADDAPGAETVRFEVTPDAFLVWNDGEFSKCDDLTTEACAWLSDKEHRCDFHSFREVASGDKESRERTTGAFGIGFTSVYQITDRPELFSNGEHWILDETATEGRRIQRNHGVETSGTRFVLPWAREQSSMRREIAQPAVTDERITELTSELLDVAPELLLFLNQLESIQVVADGRTTTFRCQVGDDVARITDDDGNVRRWLILVTDMGDAARRLREAHPTLIHSERPTEVRVAIELGVEPAPGSYFVTLPTEQSTELPLSVNGSFFPKPDRKRIRLDDDPEGRWNQAIIDVASRLVAGSLESLAEQVGDKWVARLLLAASELSKRVDSGSAERPHQVWWNSLRAAVPDARIVPTLTGNRGKAADVWLTSAHADVAEAPAASTLAKLGVGLVDTSVRTEWFQLQQMGIGLRQLPLGAITDALREMEATSGSRWVESELNGAERGELWNVVEYLLQLQGGSSSASREAAKVLSLVPTAGGRIVSPADARRPRSTETQLLSDAKIDAPLLDAEFAQRYRQITEQLVGEVTPVDMASYVSAAFGAGSVPAGFDRKRLVTWFAARHEKGLAVDRELVEDLPIFPAGGGFHPLSGLVLPDGQFRPPLALANLISDQGLHDFERSFLRSIDVPALDLRHFCTELVPSAVEQGLQPSQLETLLDFLARHRSQFQEDLEVRRALVDLELVPCIDGEVRTAREVYFGDVSILVVGDRPIAHSSRGGALKELFIWLGVATKPRPADVIAHARTLATMDPARRATAVSAVLQHLNGLEREVLDAHFSALQSERWLPVDGETSSAAPSEVYQTFRRYLFDSQARFIGIAQPVQSATGTALEWLGVRTEPPTELVVKHLLHCAAAGIPVNSQVLVRLNQVVDDPAVDPLVGQRCVLVEGRGYVHPADCFWESHPFGRHRVLLGQEFLPYRKFLDRIGVRTEPDASDVVDVLGEIATTHGGAQQPLLESDIPIVQNCWIYLDELVRQEVVDAAQLAELRRTECVLDSMNWLRKPAEVLYRDSSQIAKKLTPAASARLIARPDNMKAALDAVGVRHLRDALDTQVVDREDKAGESRFSSLVTERWSLLARVLDEFDDRPFQLLDDFNENVEVHPLHRLMVVEHLDLPGAPDDPAPSDRGALWNKERRELLVVEDQPVWAEIAREFAVALGIDGERAAQVATPLMNVMKADSRSEASDELDMLGYGDIETAIDVHVDDVPSGMPTEVPDGPDQSEPGPPQPPDSPPDSTNTSAGGGGTADASRGGPSDATTTTPTRAPTSGTSGTRSDGSDPGAKPAPPKQKRVDPKQHTPRSRLVSYVTTGGAEADADADAPDVHSHEARSSTDAAAVAAVMEFERSMGRDPEEMDHSNPGFDIRSSEPDGSVRYIEVKGTASAWDALGVGITSRQYEEAQKRGEQYWLYVVVVTADGPSEPFRIQDPASRIDRYYFDGEWRFAAEPSVASYRELPELEVFDEPDDLDLPIQVLDYKTGTETGGFVSCPPECEEQFHDGLFAVRIAGETMGLLHRGGVAFAVRASELEDGDPGVVRLLDRVDPETGGVLSVRFFGEETSATGEREAVYLETDTGIPPIGIDDLATIEIMGRVVFCQLPG